MMIWKQFSQHLRRGLSVQKKTGVFPSFFGHGAQHPEFCTGLPKPTARLAFHGAEPFLWKRVKKRPDRHFRMLAYCLFTSFRHLKWSFKAQKHALNWLSAPSRAVLAWCDPIEPCISPYGKRDSNCPNFPETGYFPHRILHQFE
jgi:hypothetical protein